MQNQIFKLSNKLNEEAASKVELRNSGNAYENEIKNLKSQLDDMRSLKAELSSSLQALALRRFVRCLTTLYMVKEASGYKLSSTSTSLSLSYTSEFDTGMLHI